MTKKTVKTLTTVILAFLVASILYLITSFATEYLSGKTRCDHIYNSLILEIESNGSSTNFSNFTKKENGFESLKIYKNSESLFIFPSNTTSDIQETALIKVYNSQNKSGEDIIHIQAAMQLIRPYRAFAILEVTFIFVLIVTLLAGCLLLFIFIGEKKGTINLDSEEVESDKNDFTIENQEEEHSTPLSTDNEDSFNLNETITDSDSTLPENKQEHQKDEEETAYSLNPKNILHTIETVKEESPFEANKIDLDTIIDNAQASEEEMITFDDFVPSAVNEPSEKDETKEEEKTEPLSQNTLIKSSDALKEDLEKELIKAGANEQDLSLFLINIPSLQLNTEKGINISQKLIDLFLIKDIYSINNDIIAIIKADQNIDQAEDFADSVFNQIKNECESFCKTPFIGISSRSTRMLSAERLINEAREALNHALEDPSLPIIGFHVDIEKYREYLKNSQ